MTEEVATLPEHWGQLGHLSSAQSEALNQLLGEIPREQIDIAKYSTETDEQVALRFLRARQFDITRTKELLAECYKRKVDGKAKFYASLKPDECSQCDIAVLRTFYPHTQRGYDKFNRPVLLERNGRTDVNAVYLLTSKETLIAYHFWNMEYFLDQMFLHAPRIEGKPATISTLAILDFAELGLAHCSSRMLDLVKTFVGLDNTCYPETLGKMLVINAPWLATTTWSIVKSWLDPRTQAKIEIIGPGPDSVKRLQELIDLDYLPAEFGGNAPDLYWKKPHTEFLQVPRGGDLVRTIDVPAGKTLFVDSYLGEGSIEVLVTSSPTLSSSSHSMPEHNETSSGGGTPRKSQSTRSFFGGRKSATESSEASTTHERREIKVAEGSTRGSERLLLKIPQCDSDRVFKVTWKNLSKYYSRPMVYSLTLSDTDDFPDTLKMIEEHTAIDRSSKRNSKVVTNNQDEAAEVAEAATSLPSSASSSDENATSKDDE